MNAPTGVYNPERLEAAITAYHATKDALALLHRGSYQWMDAAERHADAAAALRRLLTEAAPHFGLPPSDTDGAYTAHLRHMNPDWQSWPETDVYYEGVILWRSGERCRTEPCSTQEDALFRARECARESKRPIRAIWTRRRNSLEPPEGLV